MKALDTDDYWMRKPQSHAKCHSKSHPVKTLFLCQSQFRDEIRVTCPVYADLCKSIRCIHVFHMKQERRGWEEAQRAGSGGSGNHSESDKTGDILYARFRCFVQLDIERLQMERDIIFQRLHLVLRFYFLTRTQDTLYSKKS